MTLTFDLLTFKSVWESHVPWGTTVQSFVFLGLLVFELELMDDGRRSSLNAPPLRGGGIIKDSARRFVLLKLTTVMQTRIIARCLCDSRATCMSRLSCHVLGRSRNSAVAPLCVVAVPNVTCHPSTTVETRNSAQRRHA